MPSDDFYNVNSTNFNRNPQAKSLILRKQQDRPQPGNFISNKPWYNSPVYLPKHFYAFLSEDVKKELDKYNQEKKTNYQPNKHRIAKVDEQDHGDEEPS